MKYNKISIHCNRKQIGTKCLFIVCDWTRFWKEEIQSLFKRVNCKFVGLKYYRYLRTPTFTSAADILQDVWIDGLLTGIYLKEVDYSVQNQQPPFSFELDQHKITSYKVEIFSQFICFTNNFLIAWTFINFKISYRIIFIELFIGHQS